MHVEFHYPISPWIHIHIRVVAIGDRSEHTVNILADIITDVHHPNQPRTPNNRCRARIPITPTRHVQVVGRCDTYCWLKSSQPNSVVSTYCTYRSVVPNENGGAVELIRDLGCVCRVGIVIPGVVGDSLGT